MSDWTDADTYDDPYPLLRESLSPEFRDLPAEHVEALFENMGLSAEDMEFNLGRALRSVGRAAARLAPTVLPIAGAALGTVVGGPAGGALGGSLGSLAGGAIGSATRPRSSGVTPGLAANPARGVPPRAGASPAAAQLMQLLSRPEVLRALQSMAVGRPGTPTIPVGSRPVPVGAFANLIGTLANTAAAEHHVVVAGAGGVPEYLLDETGEAVVDVSVPELRAERLMDLLDEALMVEALRADMFDRRLADDSSYEDIGTEDIDDDEDLWDLLDALDDGPEDDLDVDDLLDFDMDWEGDEDEDESGFAGLGARHE